MPLPIPTASIAALIINPILPPRPRVCPNFVLPIILPRNPSPLENFATASFDAAFVAN